MRQQVRFGFERGTGHPVDVPVRHLLLSGITQGSGKTTALRALAERSNARVVVFEIKQQDRPDFIGHGRTLPLFFRGQIDALTLKETLERRSKMGLKREFAPLIQACEGAPDIHTVLWNIRKKLEPPPPPSEANPKPRRIHPLEKNSLLILESLLSGLMEEIIKSNPSNRMELHRGLNCFDLRGLSDEYQQLIVKSVSDYLYEHESNVIVCLDEGHRWLPEQAPSACKASLRRLVKEGGSRNIWLWFATQAITSLDKQALKQCSEWFIGRQTEHLEVERALAQVPLPRQMKPRPDEVMRLPVGYFFHCSETGVQVVYAMPSWLSEWGAREHARKGYTALPPPQPSSLPVPQGA